MPEAKAGAEKKAQVKGDDERLSLRRAFETFQRQSEMLEKSHAELKSRLHEAQLDLAEKNRQLAASLEEIGAMKERLAGVLESIDDAVMLVSSAGRLEVSNESARRLLAECGGNDSSGIEGIDWLEEALSSESAVRDSSVKELKTPSGRRRLIISALPMKGGGGTVVSVKDVSELMELQERVGREDRLAALGKVAASVAHEIRNPLGAIEGFGILLERDLKDMPQLKALASKTVYAARQLNSVVGNLLSYTREIRVDASPMPVATILEGTLEFVNPLAQDRKVSIESGQGCDASMRVFADAVQMRQVFTNVLINAVEACPHRNGGEISIKWRDCGDGFASIEVSDNGSGVSHGLKKRIFEPFFTSKDGGTGLGLSLCHRIVEAHGGEISEVGEEGRGARFCVRLKIASEDAT